MANENDNALIPAGAPRLPMPPEVRNSPLQSQWRVLTDAIFPTAKDPSSILLAVEYCKARGLDILKRPVNIVSIWNSELGRSVETVWPAINEVEITASRSGAWAGMDEPKFGPMITEKFVGEKKDRKQGWIKVEIEVTYPEWCSVTVYRLVGGQKCAFTEPVWWKEAYGRFGSKTLPNDMWARRPRGQIVKVAKAFSLRAAFPEEGDITDVEMEGQTISPPPAPAAPTDNWKPPADMQNVDQHQKATPQEAAGDSSPGEDSSGNEAAKQGVPFTRSDGDGDGDGDGAAPFDEETGEVGPREIELNKNEPWRDWCSRFLVFIRAETELAVIEQWVKKNGKIIEALVKDAPKIHAQLSAAIGRHRASLVQQQDEGNATSGREDRPH